ncbi:hypothetical protein [Mycobacterium sp.]|uniref:hypothetical protein n=1 Tax=Mycobacterium sp. TaxID=1785 RepID=UPI001278A3D1|nr:hypothetical protein [Mycobacterium sp.]KAA8962467.1 MAG: hypothetical protein F6Q13_12355 [Mycobacterium sp.]
MTNGVFAVGYVRDLSSSRERVRVLPEILVSRLWAQEQGIGGGAFLGDEITTPLGGHATGSATPAKRTIPRQRHLHSDYTADIAAGKNR